MKPLVAIPIKPFGVAKARLAPALDAPQRSLLGKGVAGHTVQVAHMLGGQVAVVTGDTGVAEFARELEAEVIWEPPGLGLNGAATAAAAHAEDVGNPWAILHADLPHLRPADLEAAVELLSHADYVLAPSYDGGTSFFMGRGPFAFSYGPASFHRHLAATAGRAAVLVRTGFAMDLDTPLDLEAMQRVGISLTWHGVS